MTTEQIDMPPLRPLGIFERFMVARSQQGVYHKVGVTAFYSSDRKATTKENLKPAIYSALALVISKHANLSITPVGVDSSESYFVRLPYVNLDEVVTFTEVENILDGQGRHRPALDHFLEREHSRPWDLRVPLPLWRLHILQQPEGDASRFVLCYMFHHAIGDTKSALVFHQALEEALNTTDGGTETSSMVSSPDLPLIPPLDAFVDTTREVDGGSAPEEAGAVWTGAGQFLPVRTRFRSLRFGGDESIEFLRLCKAHGVSLTAAIQAMLVTALFEKLPSEYTALRTDCPISLREWLPAPVGALSMGILVDTFLETHQRPNLSHGGKQGSFAWVDDAQTTKKRIDRAVRERRGDGLLEKLSHVKDVETWTMAKMGQPRTTSLELSNVGRLPSLTENIRSARIHGLVFSQSAGAVSGAIKVSCVTGRDGRVSLGFTWQQGVVEDGFIDDFLDEFQSIFDGDLIFFQQMHNGP
ncbi:Alcohol acetyltransferase [Knufia peltigerae]|uniref:Alcohol acetyltransferase n=1 Tax=Knufia peltigerae TaxID=1002370 RepID=A0AA38Y2S4_9EURO|nr:Alcohol acetyltransferase [Knufia peltigerae]